MLLRKINYLRKILILSIPLFILTTSTNLNQHSLGLESTAQNILVEVMIHYDNYYPSINTTDMHLAFEKALSWLKNEGFPMNKVTVVTWRNTLDDEEELAWFRTVLNKYGVSESEEQLGLYISPKDAHNPNSLIYALETFKNKLGRYPFFVAGMSASSYTYSELVEYGVKLSFFNLWEEGEDYSYRGYSTNDELFGANWEGSPFQPYKPSRRTANAPGLTESDELDIWEAHWITRNPSYAFMIINSRNWGSLHPSDLLWKDWSSEERASSSEALGKLKAMLNLIDLNAQFNPIINISYPTEVSLLLNSDVFNVWCASIKEFKDRGYRFVNAVELRNILDNIQKNGAPHTPIYIWFDNLTSSDLIIAGEHTPFVMLSSPYGRFIYSRKDPLKDSGTPLISIVSYTTAKAHNSSFQSIRELTGVGEMKMNTFINGVPVDMRWINDISKVIIMPGEAVGVEWSYTKKEVPYINYRVLTYLTPYGVLVNKEINFTANINAQVSIVHYLTVQSCSPTPFSDIDVKVETDTDYNFVFSSKNPTAIARECRLNNTLMLTADDGYSLGVTIISGNPDQVRVIDEAGESSFQTLEFHYDSRMYHTGDRLELTYALISASDIEDASSFAEVMKNIIEKVESRNTSVFIIGAASTTRTRFSERDVSLTLLVTLSMIVLLTRLLRYRT